MSVPVVPIGLADVPKLHAPSIAAAAFNRRRGVRDQDFQHLLRRKAWEGVLPGQVFGASVRRASGLRATGPFIRARAVGGYAGDVQ